jgi:hypothetical protein
VFSASTKAGLTGVMTMFRSFVDIMFSSMLFIRIRGFYLRAVDDIHLKRLFKLFLALIF